MMDQKQNHDDIHDQQARIEKNLLARLRDAVTLVRREKLDLRDAEEKVEAHLKGVPFEKYVEHDRVFYDVCGSVTLSIERRYTRIHYKIYLENEYSPLMVVQE